MQSQFVKYTLRLCMVLCLSSSAGCAMFDDGDDMEDCYFVSPDGPYQAAPIAPSVGPPTTSPSRVLPGPAGS